MAGVLSGQLPLPVSGYAALRTSGGKRARVLDAPAPGVYTVTVRAFNVPSSAQPFALVISGAVNRAPDPVTATAVTDTQISVSWSAVPGALKYFVFQSTAGGPFNFSIYRNARISAITSAVFS